MTLCDGDTFERGGKTFRVKLPYDDSAWSRNPWDEDDGNGVILERRAYYGERPNKAPHERVLYHDGRTVWLYDMRATLKRAKEQGWGLYENDLSSLAKHLRRTPTPKQIRAEAIERDFDRWRRYMNNEWSYVGIVVTLLDDDKNETGDTESIWGVESDCAEHIQMCSYALADEILARLRSAQDRQNENDAREMETARPDLYAYLRA